MNFANFNPSMFNNIDHNQMKMASDMMSGMSDEQLRSYASMMGMPQMDPQMMRNQMNMMKGMDSSQFENMKNAAKNFAPPGGAGGYSGYSPSSQNEGLKRQHSTPVSDPKPVSKYTRIENLKIKGNDFFKKEQYDQAGSAYFEAIIEIEELRSQNKKLKDDDLDTLEISCRMNYANVKSKEEDYDTVLSQAKKVLAIKENGKAYFRLGQAQFHLKKYNEALQSLNKAIPLLPGDSTVSDLRDKVQNILSSSSQEEKEEPKKKKQEASEEPKVVEENREEPKEEHKPKLKKKNAPKVEDLPLPAHKPKEERYSAPPESIIREKPYEEEVKIEEEKAQPAPPRQESSTSSGFNYGNYGPNVSEEKFKQGQQHLSNMSPDQMKMMTDYFKGMDNATLKTMLKGQMGMDISDSQLESMKMMMTPEMLQNVSKMDMSQMPKGAFPSSAGTTSTSSSRPAQPAGTCTHDHDHSEHDHHHHHAQPQPQGMPGMPTMPPGMDFKLEQAQGMIDMMIQNPEMLKNMIGMIGEGNPIAKFVKNRSPQDLAKYLKVLRAGLKVYAKVSPLINFLKKYWQLIAGMMIAWAIIRIFNLA